MSENERLDKWKKLYEETSYKNNGAASSPVATTNHPVRRTEYSNVHTIHYVPVESPVKYVGFWRRLFAFFIDAVITSLFSLFTHNRLILFVFVLLYYSLLTSSNLKGTIGKAAIGAIVVDNYGRRISFGRAVGRYLSYFISSILFLIGFLMIAFHGQKRGFMI